MSASNRIPPDQWSDPRQRDGWDAELLAAKWLVRRGWRIEAHRFKQGRHDLDLVARKGGLIAFIEVKARRSIRCGAGEEAVDHGKRRIVERAAWAWILRYGQPDDEYRFDVIALAANGPGTQDIRHIEDAWRPGWR